MYPQDYYVRVSDGRAAASAGGGVDGGDGGDDGAVDGDGGHVLVWAPRIDDVEWGKSCDPVQLNEWREHGLKLRGLGV